MKVQLKSAKSKCGKIFCKKQSMSWKNMKKKDTYSLLLLAGGKSSRMGTNKAELIYQGQTFVKTLLSKAKALGIEQIYISGFKEDGITTVWDIYPEQGPIGGIHACMKQVKTPYCIVIPVDVPQIPTKVLEKLIEFHEKNESRAAEHELPVLIKHGERRENLIGIYPVQMADYIEDRIKKGKLSVHGMLDDWGNICFEINIPQWQVENINTREAYEELLAMSKEGK